MTVTNLDDYRERHAPSGTIEFLPGGEQVDLHASELVARLTREVMDLATAEHSKDPSDTDETRDKLKDAIGGGVVGIAEDRRQAPIPAPEVVTGSPSEFAARLGDCIRDARNIAKAA